MNAGRDGPPSGRPPIPVLHLITGLDRGGAETMLAKLVSRPSTRLAHRVVSLMSSEAVRDLGLEPGVLAVAVIKSTNVVVETPARS